MTSLTRSDSSHTSRDSGLELPVLRTESEPFLDTLGTPSSESVFCTPSSPVDSCSSTAADKQSRAQGSSPARVMAVKGMVPILVGMMLLTGCCNTLLTKYQVHCPVRGNEAPC